MTNTWGETMNVVLAVENLSKSYGKVAALTGISFEVPEKSIFGFLGPNGAGKTTTIGIILQFLYQDAGKVSFFGETVTSRTITHMKRYIGFIPDATLPKIDGLRLLKHSGRYFNLTGQALRERITEVVKTTQAQTYIKRNTAMLSKGQKQRIKIANALMNDPTFIIADEPTAGLDPVGQKDFLDLLKHLRDDLGKTIFLSSHIISEVEKITNQVVILSQGKVVAQGSLESITQKLGFAHRYVVSVEGVSLPYLQALPQVKAVSVMSPGRYIIETTNDYHSNTPAFLPPLITNPDSKLLYFSHDIVTLEDIFFMVINNGNKN